MQPSQPLWENGKDTRDLAAKGIRESRQPLVNVDWGLHITEMLCGAIESSKTGQRYRMTTTV